EGDGLNPAERRVWADRARSGGDCGKICTSNSAGILVSISARGGAYEIGTAGGERDAMRADVRNAGGESTAISSQRSAIRKICRQNPIVSCDISAIRKTCPCGNLGTHACASGSSAITTGTQAGAIDQIGIHNIRNAFWVSGRPTANDR